MWQPDMQQLLDAGCVITTGKWGALTLPDRAYKDGVLIATHGAYGRWWLNHSLRSKQPKPRFRVKALSVKATS